MFKVRRNFDDDILGFTFCGALFDGFVCYFVKDLDLYDEDKNAKARLERIKMKKFKAQNDIDFGL